MGIDQTPNHWHAVPGAEMGSSPQAHCPFRSRICSTTALGSTQGLQRPPRGWDQPGGVVQHGKNPIPHPTR